MRRLPKDGENDQPRPSLDRRHHPARRSEAGMISMLTRIGAQSERLSGENDGRRGLLAGSGRAYEDTGIGARVMGLRGHLNLVLRVKLRSPRGPPGFRLCLRDLDMLPRPGYATFLFRSEIQTRRLGADPRKLAWSGFSQGRWCPLVVMCGLSHRNGVTIT